MSTLEANRKAGEMENTINVVEAKAHFSDYLSRAEKGEEIIISRHNKPVAKLVPIGAQVKEETLLRPFGEVLLPITEMPGCWDPMTDEEYEALLGKGEPF
jgi:prevent-host-death family protein